MVLEPVRLRQGSLGRRAHPVQLLDDSLIEIPVGIGVAVRVVGATDLFQRSHIVGQVMHLGHPVAVLGHLALKLGLCAFACVVQRPAAKTPTILVLARGLIFSPSNQIHLPVSGFSSKRMVVMP
jgi:hypothetical protein